MCSNWDEYDYIREDLLFLDVPLLPRPEEFELYVFSYKRFPNQNSFCKDEEGKLIKNPRLGFFQALQTATQRRTATA